MGNPEPWTSEMDARLRELTAREMTAGAIGKLMGKTRNSIIGRRRRLGIKLSPAEASKKRSESGKRNMRKPPRPAAAPAPVQVVAIPIEQLKAAVSMKKIGRRQCRYIGERPELLTQDTPVYCGAATAEGSSWCPTHRARVFQPRR